MVEVMRMKNEYTMPTPTAASMEAQSKASRAFVRQKRLNLGLPLVPESDLPRLLTEQEIVEEMSKIKGVRFK